MYGKNLLKLEPGAETKSSEAIAVESQPVSSEVLKQKQDVTAIPNEILFIIPIGFVTLWVIIAFRLAKLADRFSYVTFKFPVTFETIGDEMLTIEHFHKFPCRSCRYFEDNPYLKCAVHPDNALTVRSLNCSDYRSPNENR